MSIRIVRLGTPRATGEGVRIGTVRRPPRGVKKTALAAEDWYDVWFPILSPSAPVVKLALSAETLAQWGAFVRRYRAEMAKPEPSHALAPLSTLSYKTDFAVGCYCADESCCHRSVLRALLVERGAKVAPQPQSTPRG